MSKHNVHLTRSMTLIIILILTLSACRDGEKDKDVESSFVCTDKLGCVTINPGQPIKITSLQVLSGDPAPLGRTQDQSIRLAVAERGGALLGHPIEITSEDDLCTREGGANAALRIVADPQIVAILGSTCSGAASGTIPIMSDSGLVMISGLNTAPSLTSIGGERGADWYPGYYRVITNGIAQADAASRFAYEELDLRRAATINDGDAFSVGLAAAFEESFVKQGGTILAHMTVNKGDEDMRPLLEAIALSGADVVFMPIFQPEADYIVNQSQEIEGLENLVFIAMDSLFLDSFIEAVDENGLGIYFVTATLEDTPTIVDLRARYEEFYGEQPQHNGYIFAYDATNLLLDAIRAIAVQSEAGHLYIGRQSLRDYLYQTEHYDGVSGSLTCDEFGDCSAAILLVTRLDDVAAGRAGLLNNVLTTYRFNGD